jgi:hypothetical protein
MLIPTGNKAEMLATDFPLAQRLKIGVASTPLIRRASA